MEKVEESMKKAVEIQRPRKLNFNAPLLSTRRPAGCYNVEEMSCSANSQAASRDITTDRIPFSWEQVPGKPKNTQTHEGDSTPRPRLPPSRWHPLPETTNKEDDGCDGDVDDDDNNDDDVFSDAMEVFSLTEAMDIVEKAQKEEHGLDRSMLESFESSYKESPNFMIKRFLPAANALAASSVLAASRNLGQYSYPEEWNSQVATTSYSSLKAGCGLEIFFPWRTKHKLCGIKTPVRQATSPNAPPQYSGKQHNMAKFQLTP